MTSPSRRHFLKTGAAAAIAGPASTFAGPERKSCCIAIGTYGLQSLPLIDALKLIAKTGYHFAEISVFPGMTGEPTKLSPTDRKEISKLELGICALMADLKPSADKKKHVETTDELKRILDLARDLNPVYPPLVQTILGGKNWDNDKNLFRDRVADWMQICADQKIELSVKPHRNHAMSTPAEAAWLLKQLGSSKWVGMTYDASHYAFRDGLPLAETIATALRITNYVAVKDAIKLDGGKIGFALAGTTGNPDIAQIVKSFNEGGYRGEFCCEVSSLIWKKDPNYDPVAATQICYKNMVTAFKKAGVKRHQLR